MKFFNKFVLVAVAFFTCIFIWQSLHTKFKPSSGMNNLERQFESIKPIESAKKIGERKKISKLVKQVISEDYNANLPVQVILSYYAEQLQKQGWKMKSTINTSSYTFCMGDVDATIEITDLSNTRFNFEVRWEGVESIRTGCK